MRLATAPHQSPPFVCVRQVLTAMHQHCMMYHAADSKKQENPAVARKEAPPAIQFLLQY